MKADEFERIGMPVQDGLGIFMIDFAVYFPYLNQDELQLELSLSTEACVEGYVYDIRGRSVINKRYPNKGYLCLSLKNGRKVCKAGCPVQLPYDELNAFRYLNIGYGFVGDMARMSVPVNIGVSEGLPCVGLEAHVIFEKEAPCEGLSSLAMLEMPKKPELSLVVHEGTHDNGWHLFGYALSSDGAIVNAERFGADRFKVLTPCDPLSQPEPGWMVFREAVKLYPATLRDMMA